MKKNIVILILTVFSVAAPTHAEQTSLFTYQGNLKDGPNVANGNYDFEFRLFDAINGGTQVGKTVNVTNVVVTSGTFTAKIDFGDFLWNGLDRYLEVRVRNVGAGAYVLLSPREKVLSSPYAVRSVFANEASVATTAGNSTLFGGFGINSFVFTNDFRLSDPRTPTAGSPHYIQNNASGQNVDIYANGTIHSTTIWGDTVRATNQYNLGNARVLHTGGGQGIYVGIGAGAVNSSGGLNAFYGNQSGAANTSGSFNSFFGGDTGSANIIGNHNSFFGARAGFKTTSSFNAFFGSGAGFENISGHSNSFVGYLAGGSNTSGFENSFFGRNSGIVNTTGEQNSFFGAYSGTSSTTGNSNAFFGSSAGRNNTTGASNAFFGAGAGFTSTSAANNSFFGTNAGFSNTSGTNNAFFGRNSGISNTSGNENSFFGSGTNNGSGSGNSFFGYNAGSSNSSASRNSFFGHKAGDANSTGEENSFFGSSAGNSNTIGSNNSYFGHLAGADVTAGTSNTLIGHNTGSATTIGDNNTFVGKGAGTTNTTGSNNTLIGYDAEVSAGNLSFATAIGSGAVVEESNTIVIGRMDDSTIISGRFLFVGMDVGSALELCYRTPAGLPKSLATCSSSARYKHDFAVYKGGLGIVERLRPVTFKWNSTEELDLGLVAEEVAIIDPLLATYKEDGEIEGVKYRQMTVVLINAVKEQQAQIEELKSANQELKSAVCGLIPSLAVCGKKEK